MQNYRLTLAYDGTRYRGWQRLPPPAKTVQASVETALGDIFGQPLEISGSGRTDAGVHAACQVASFHAPKRPTDEVLGQLRRLLPEDIGALTLDYAPERFHARLSAVEKTYVYRLWNSDRPDVFARRYRAWEPRQLDCGAMRAGAAGLVGTHDFFTFCANRQMSTASRAWNVQEREELLTRADTLPVLRLADSGDTAEAKQAVQTNRSLLGSNLLYAEQEGENYIFTNCTSCAWTSMGQLW